MDGKRAQCADEDAELVARFQRGDTAAFDTLFARYQDYVHNIVYGIIGNAEEARDVTQEVFLQVYRGLPRFRRGARFATWLYRIAINCAVDAARGARRWRFLPLHEEPSLATRKGPVERQPESVAERHAERDALQKVMMRCPLAHRQVLALRYYHDLTLEEIAETLGCSVTAAKVRLHRARNVFRQNYVATFGSESPNGYKWEEADVTRPVR
jgi:RNA polymerase sigma-70 factor (ECF subfamily)